MRAAEAVTRWDLYRFYKHKKLPSSTPLLDGEQYLLPRQCESGDWVCFMPPGRPPLYREFVCSRLCHWLSDANRLVASLLFPDLHWGVVSSDKHTSVVCPEERLLFDLNFHTMGVTAEASLQMMFGDDFKNPDWLWHPEDTYDCTASEMTSQALRFWSLCDSHEGDKQSLVADLERLLDDEAVSSDTATDIAWECSGLLMDAQEPQLEYA
ncbi:hypothetical protein OAK65_03795 [Synechococcus sp. AH-551-N17]|nr:hypothetical protein [Synechococcus sp. AH-551-N17]